MIKKAGSAVKIVQEEGALRLISRTADKLSRKYGKYSGPRPFKMLVKEQDVLDADFVGNPYNPPELKAKKNYVIDWIMSPPGKGSGGHQTIFRHIRALEDAGHSCRVRLYTNHDTRTLSEVTDTIRGDFFTDVKAEISVFDKNLKLADAVFATGWETAYPVFNMPSSLKKFYFVQDFEPYFYPVGSEYILAENTYKFNFYGLTAGRWLSTTLAKKYKMKTDYFDFGVDHKIYNLRSLSARKAIFVYVRPTTARRGFELAMMSLKLFAQQRPDYEIHLAGWDMSEYEVPFPHISHGTVSMEKLSDLYNISKAALVISLTNMSLLPHELLACGCTPLLNSGKNNTVVSDNSFIQYCEMSPASTARKLIEIVDRKHDESYLKDMAASVKDEAWDKTTKRFVKAFEKFMAD
jgi:glycosyltransferase involved in cell wall biosynthesis